MNSSALLAINNAKPVKKGGKSTLEVMNGPLPSAPRTRALIFDLIGIDRRFSERLDETFKVRRGQ